MAGEMFDTVPAIPAQAARFATLRVSAPAAQTPGRWEAGFAWRPETCFGGRSWNWCLTGENPGDPPPSGYGPDYGSDATGPVYHVPVTHEVTDECGTEVAFNPDRARRQLEAATSFLMARELWTGERAKVRPYETPTDALPVVNAHLASDAAEVIPGARQVAHGLATLEAEASRRLMGQPVVLHVVPDVLPLFEGVRSGNTLTTQAGSLVIADAGYPNTGPDGTAPATGFWAYATGSVEARIGAINVDDWTDWRVNVRYAKAQRLAAVTFDPCVLLATLLTLPDDGLST